MMEIGTKLATLIAAGALAISGLAGAGPDRAARSGPETALIIDASQGRDGRELVDPRLRSVNADVRLPRNTEEALANVRYFAALGHRLVVVGPKAARAARAAGIDAVHAPGIRAAIAAARR
jgi:hypothetical protein